MIAFVSLFLGLVAGPQVVQVAVSERVAAVELRLDGEAVARLTGKPWKAEIDFGVGLTTHQLVAVAFDRFGAEVDRALQQINVPRPANETEILLGGWRDGRPHHARLIWHSRQLLDPESITVSLDGRELAVADPGRIELPPVDAQAMHFISAELVFPGNERSTAQAIFGGRYGEQVESELTAVPVLLDGRRLKTPRQGQGWLRRRDGGALRVVAVENDAAQLFIVRDEATLPALGRLLRQLRAEQGRAYRRLGLEMEDRQFLTSSRAVVTEHADLAYELYPISRGFGLEEVALPEALAHFEVDRRTTTVQRLSDAVAVAGVRAAAGGRRRAVLLVVADCAQPSGRWSGEAVRRYLAELRVPLEVWTTERPGRGGDGFCRNAWQLVDTDTYGAALARLRRRLRKQQILWVQGSHLPHQVVLAEGVAAREVARID